MEKLPARTGWLWLKQGFGLFRQQPGALSILFLGYMLMMLIAGMIPLLGQVLPVLLVPVFSVAFMQANANIDQKKRVLPKVLLSGFHQPALWPLLSLGLLYLVVAALAIGASALVDGGIFWQLITGQLDPKSPLIEDSNLGGGLLLALFIYVPCIMAFWFAAPLIYWQQMKLGKAVFYSFFAVLRTFRAFIVFGAAWFAISVVGSQIVMLVFGRSEAAIVLMVPMSIMLTVIMHSSFYASYRQIFGQHYDQPTPPVNLDKTPS